MAINGGSGWLAMRNCENFMFCKPSGITLHGKFWLRVVSDTGNIDVEVTRLVGDIYVDMGSNNDGGCSSETSTSPPSFVTTTTAATPQPTQQQRQQ